MAYSFKFAENFHIKVLPAPRFPQKFGIHQKIDINIIHMKLKIMEQTRNRDICRGPLSMIYKSEN